MHLTILSDNNGTEWLPGEWGLSILIEYGGHVILLDAGASGLLMQNADRLGKDLSRVDIAVLSHAHYDHADGFVPLLRAYPALKVYIRRCAGVEKIITGHCTGEEAFAILKTRLGERITQFSAGLEMELI